MKRAIAALGLALVLAGCGGGPGEVERFHQACAAEGGFVASTGTWWTPRIDCIKDNRVVYLPGFA
ncbi:hypothetical protein I5G59_gp78 [Mycobacterium phage LilMcDreamy]|uniref:Lipoprotein n=1 Tax=Mycobacterium phage LilMcDreamy TaxID=2652422 RepID=A0A5P8D6T1_9CAUD|nr:hypothetical protein I5G59_gp78 [Mycobacterium phage LilMcDreamy]QFP94698.1 hypothetical protein SEA_LILMCDREAMY_78 [Mycobacterium phage LilMcDreamy]